LLRGRHLLSFVGVGVLVALAAVARARQLALDFHRVLDRLRHGLCHLGILATVDTGGLGQFEIAILANGHRPVSRLFRLFGHGDGLLPGLDDRLVLGHRLFSVGGTRHAAQENERRVVKDQQGLQKVSKSRREDAEDHRHGLADPESRCGQGSGVERCQADPGDPPQRRPKDSEGKARGLAEPIADHAGKGDLFLLAGRALIAAGKVGRHVKG